jgi:hypothetical protein
MKLCDACICLWTIHSLTLLKSFNFFVESLWIKNILPYQLIYFFTKFTYYYNYSAAILRYKIVLTIVNNGILHLFLDIIYIGIYVLIYIFHEFYQILFDVHIVKFWITSNKHAIIHLNISKDQISSKITETSIQQHTCCLLNIIYIYIY